jgi:hypothetical protein
LTGAFIFADSCMLLLLLNFIMGRRASQDRPMPRPPRRIEWLWLTAACVRAIAIAPSSTAAASR